MDCPPIASPVSPHPIALAGFRFDTPVQEIAVDHLQSWKESFEAVRPSLGDDADPFLAHMALKKQIDTFASEKVRVRADLETGNYRYLIRELPNILDAYGINFNKVDQDDPSFDKLCSAVLRAKERAIGLYMDRLEGRGPKDDLDAAMDAVEHRPQLPKDVMYRMWKVLQGTHRVRVVK